MNSLNVTEEIGFEPSVIKTQCLADTLLAKKFFRLKNRLFFIMLNI